jgi:hypothetical protein
VKLLRRIGRELRELVIQIYRLPEAVIEENNLRRRQAEREVLEAERLDRIRNPHKYRCQ